MSRLVESAVGTHLVNAIAASECELFYWRERSREVDFVVGVGRALSAIEVNSGRWRDTAPDSLTSRTHSRRDRISQSTDCLDAWFSGSGECDAAPDWGPSRPIHDGWRASVPPVVEGVHQLAAGVGERIRCLGRV